MWYINKGILFRYKKEGNPAIHDNMDEPGEHYAKQNKPDTDIYSMISVTCGI